MVRIRLAGEMLGVKLIGRDEVLKLLDYPACFSLLSLPLPEGIGKHYSLGFAGLQLADLAGNFHQISGPQLPAAPSFHLTVDLDLSLLNTQFGLAAGANQVGHFQKLPQPDHGGVDDDGFHRFSGLFG